MNALYATYSQPSGLTHKHLSVSAVARDRDVEQERKDMQRKLLDEQVQLKQKIVEDEKKQDKQVMS